MMGETFESLYQLQVEFQKNMIKADRYEDFPKEALGSLPVDNPKLFAYHVEHLVCEIGEVLSTDKRWKNVRRWTTPEMLEHKKEELADCFIVLMNVCIFSGMSAQDVLDVVEKKIGENYERMRLLEGGFPKTQDSSQGGK